MLSEISRRQLVARSVVAVPGVLTMVYRVRRMRCILKLMLTGVNK